MITEQEFADILAGDPDLAQALRLLLMPPVEWCAQAEQPTWTSRAKEGVVDKLSAIVQRSMSLHAYLEARWEEGDSHESARGTAHRRMARVRKLLGYAYPERGLLP